MHRRKFITQIGGAAITWPLAARAQQPPMPVIGYLSGVSPGGPFAGAVAGFRQGLSENGYTEGVNVAIEYRWAEGNYDRLAGMVDDLVRRKVSVIVASASDVGVRAGKAATTTIPIVFTTGNDPVETGLVSSLNRPAGNVTGVTLLFYRVEAKRMELLHELVPKALTIRAIVNRNNPIVATSERNLQEAAASFGLRLDVVDGSTEKDIDAAFTMLGEKQIGAIFLMS